MLPTKMKAVRQNAPGAPLDVCELPVPLPQKGEVLVKMAYAPFNPSDISALRGLYVDQKQYPFTPGIEGSGIVVGAGNGLLPKLRMGKRVCCSSGNSGGTWAEYMCTPATRVIPLKPGIGLEQGAMLIVNPMTALAFMEMARKGKHKAIVNSAAASVLGQMLIKLCKQYQLPLINIVRRSEQVSSLKNQGAEHVLNMSEEGFPEALASLSHQLGATLLFDAVGGELTAVLVDAAPVGSTIVIYSNMSDQPFSINARSLIQKDKSISNFYLGTWTSKQNILKTLKAAKNVQKLVADELQSKVRMRYPLDQVNEALNDYQNQMTGGKILLQMNSDLF
ncbi:zinc-binding dehydrogenase [Roseimarinus sediminis]|uniref:zinc-binding dehydrogenase n=1 Tax=Roseimarinus sediminis TaxID=1610899 RepID=UPI003D1E8D24